MVLSTLTVISFLLGYKRIIEQNYLSIHDFEISECFYTRDDNRHCLSGQLTVYRNSYDVTMAINDVPIKSVSGRFSFSKTGRQQLKISEKSSRIFNNSNIHDELQGKLPTDLFMKIAKSNSVGKVTEILMTPEKNMIWLINNRLIFMQRVSG
jgi:hypothetical protein